MECLAIAHLLPRVAKIIQEDLWWGLLDVLAQLIEQAEGWHVDENVDPREALAHQWMRGELPLTLAYLLPEIRPVYELRSAAQGALAEGLSELLNGAGLPHARYVSVFRALLGCWTRCHAMSAALRKSMAGVEAEHQYRLAITKAIGLSSATGHSLLCGDDCLPWSTDFLEAALREGGDGADVTAAIDLFQKRITKDIDAKSGNHVPETSESSEWSELAILRSNWSRRAPVVALDYSRPELSIDLWAGTQRLMRGEWLSESMADGKPLAVHGRWEETCWFSDSDVDYIELSIDLERGARLERQILLGREDKFLLLVDNLMNVPGELAFHKIQLPLCPQVRFEPQTETREGILSAVEPLSRVLPLALPEWRVDPRVGNLAAFGNLLQVTHERPGRNLSCPLFFDLDPKRLRKECTWRQLTVAQSLEIQPHDVAVGYRVQCGKNQWLIYRSMTAPANRTVLGYNLSIEGLVGRFLAKTGEVEELLQIEG